MTNAKIPESGLFTAFVIEFTYQKRGASVDFSQLTPEQLNGMDKRALIGIITSLQGQPHFIIQVNTPSDSPLI